MFENEFGILLYVSDVEKSAAFYRDIFGFQFHGWWSEGEKRYRSELAAGEIAMFARLSTPFFKLALHSKNAPDAPQGSEGEAGPKFHLRVANIDDFHRLVTSRGHQIAGPRNESWGWRTLSVQDPDGHKWEFYTPISPPNQTAPKES
jgi:catechol 2,3-dioxygenase-like lactoylglutathione lyase family enzyme